MKDLAKKMECIGIVPVVTIESPKHALFLGTALQKAGLPCVEITFRTAEAEKSIYKIADRFPEILLAAGTVLSPMQADIAMSAGASLIISPGLNPKTVGHCLDKGYPVLPGICTPTEIETALSMGLTYMKFFPAKAAGGVEMIRALCAPYRNIHLMPTGGVNLQNLQSYLSEPSVFACGGSWIAPSDKISKGRFDEIEVLARQAAEFSKQIISR